MKKDRILNPELLREIAALGHTEGICIADCGLPVPPGVKVIDLSLITGIPSFLDVLMAVCSELVIESYLLAEEISEKNAALEKEVQQLLHGLPCEKVPHERFKALTRTAKCIVRTGEASPYANILLIGGVNF